MFKENDLGMGTRTKQTDFFKTNSIKPDEFELHKAVAERNLERVQFILLSSDKKNDINAQDEAGNTALHYILISAKENEDFDKLKDILELLIERGADTRIKNLAGNIPLQTYGSGNNKETINKLYTLLYPIIREYHARAVF
jgi:ankyrin repeat protein